MRVRFYVSSEDYRPVVWPISHPYWCTGYRLADDDSLTPIVVAYVDDEAQLFEWWPDASDVDVMNEDCSGYTFTDRFPRPEWLK